MITTRRLVVVVLLLGLARIGATQEVTVNSIGALGRALRAAQPGTTVLIAPGTYRAPRGRKVFWLANVHGAPGRPITIRAQDPQNRPVFQGGNEGFHLARCSYIVVDGIICEGAHVNNMQFDFCRYIVIMNSVSRNMAATGNNGNCDGIKMPGTSDFLIYNCTVERWGAQGSAIDMVGCARGLMARCRFNFPAPARCSANCTQPKSGTFGIGIYRCVFDDASLRSVQFGGAGRPMHLGIGRNQSGLDQVAMGNIIVSGECPIVYACASNTVFAYNTIVRPTGYVVRILREGDYRPMANNVITRNLIVYDRNLTFMQNGPRTFPRAVSWAENYWYNSVNPARSIPTLPVAERAPAGGRDPRLDRTHRPANDSPARAYGAHAAGLDAAWAQHTAKFAWAWRQYQLLEGGKAAKASP